MQTARKVTSSESFEFIEESVFAYMTSLKDRLEALSLSPITNEAEIRAVKAALDKLIIDMQALSNSLTEGTSSDNIHGYLRDNVVLEKGYGTTAA